MEALGSPSIWRDPMGGGHAFQIPKTSVCRLQVQRPYTFVIFDCLCIFVFVSFWFCFSFLFFASLHITRKTKTKTKQKRKKKKKNKKKKNIKNNNNLRSGRTKTLLCRSFYRLSREKSVVYVLCKNLHQNVPFSLNESCSVCR